MRIDAADREVCAHDASLGIQPAGERRERKSKGWLAAVAETENRRIRSSGEKRRIDQSGWTPAELLLHVRRGEPVVINSKAAAYHPLSVASRIPGNSHARAPQIIDRREQRIVCCLCKATRNLLLLGAPGPEIEIPEHCRGALGPGIPTVVIAQPQRERQVLFCLPSIFHKSAPRPGGSIPVPQLLFAGLRVIHDATFTLGCVLRERQQVVEGELRLRPWPLERLDVVAVPALVSELQRVGATHMRQHIAPVVVVLDEVTLRKADAVSLTAVGVDA